MNVKQERMWGMLCHLSAFTGCVIPFANIIAPLIIWLTQKDKSNFVEEHGRESLNFQISVTLYAFIAGILTVIGIGVIILAGLGIFNIIFLVIASINANDGNNYRYPFTIKFIKPKSTTIYKNSTQTYPVSKNGSRSVIRKCASCGKILESNDKFCKDCGSPVS